MRFIYLATPYTDPSPAVEEQRFNSALWAASILASETIPCYSPIAAWHQVSVNHNLLGDHEFWRRQDESFMQACLEGWFIRIPGWETSKGMDTEAKYLEDLYKPIRFIEPLELKSFCSKWKAGLI